MSDNLSDKVLNQSNLVKLRREKGVQHEYNIKPESYDKELKEAQQKLEKIQQIEKQIQKIEEKELRRSSQSRLSNSDQEELATGETKVEEVSKAKHDSVKSEPAAEPPSRNESLDQSLTEISQSILSENMLDDSVLEPVGENSEEDQEAIEEQTEDQTEVEVKNSRPTTAQKFEDIIGEMTDEIEKSYEAEANCRNELERDEIIEPETPNDSLVEVPDQTPSEIESFNDSIPIPEYYTKTIKSELQGEEEVQEVKSEAEEPVTKSENIPTFITEVPSDKDVSESETNVDLQIRVHSVTEQIPPQPQIQEEEVTEVRNSFVSTSSFEEKTIDPEVTCVNSEDLNESQIPEIQTSMEPQGKIHINNQFLLSLTFLDFIQFSNR